jgi:hypothetical protein
MANEIDLKIEEIIARLQEIPVRLHSVLKPVEDKLKQIASELNAAGAIADAIIDNAGKRAADIDAKAKKLNEAVRDTARALANG